MTTYREYRSFCQEISRTGISRYTVEEACRSVDALNDQQFVVIKHDVECAPQRALEMSHIEHAFGIKATYYVHSHFLRDSGSVAMFREIRNLGHEIGYHFDVLDSTDGDTTRAVLAFTEALSRFAENGFNVRTVCPHGNPLKSRTGYSSNKEFFLNQEVRRTFPDIVDVYVTFPDMLKKDYLYVSDARYSYMYRDAKSTKTDSSEHYIPLDSQHEIARLLQDGNSLIVSVHSHRYCRFGATKAMRIAVYRAAKYMGETLYRVKLGQYLIDRFYFLARRI